MVFLKHNYISKPTFTAADAVISVAQNMADTLKKEPTPRQRSPHGPLQPTKIFAHAATNKKASEDPAQHTPNTKMTHLPAPALNTAP